jgi:hypothetical protein
MSFLVIQLDKQLRIINALELSTHGLAMQRAHEFIDAGFCARVVDKPIDPVAWFQKLKEAPLILEAREHISTPLEASSMSLPTLPPLISKVRLVSHRTPVRPISSNVRVESLIPRRRVIIKRGFNG